MQRKWLLLVHCYYGQKIKEGEEFRAHIYTAFIWSTINVTGGSHSRVLLTSDWPRDQRRCQHMHDASHFQKAGF